MNGPPSVDDMRMHVGAPVVQARIRRDAGRAVGLVVLVAVFALLGGSVLAASSSSHSWFPSRWDARVAPIAAEVASLRGLEFKHPVPIHYLTPKEFEKRLGTGGAPSASDRAEITREESVFRSLGFIGGKVDLLHEINTQASSDTLAYYDPDREEIIVRGTTLDAEHRVTVAHELTHVLQDQHFNLPKLQKRAADSDSGDASALKALVEGDAVRIENDYLAQLSPAEHKEYDRENAVEGARVGKETSSVPDIVSIVSEAPYELGESTVRVLLEAGGNSAIDDALTGPPPSTEVFVQAGDITAPVAVDEPVLPAGAVRVGSPETFGPFETFLTLAMRLDPARALGAADLVAGGRAVSFRNGASNCYRVVVAPTEEHSRAYLLAAVEAWAHGRAKTTVDAVGDRVGFTACDPGRNARNPPSSRLQTAMEILGFRTAVTVDAAKGHVSGDFARCIARVFVAQPGAEQLVLAVGNGTPTAQQGERLSAIGLASGDACRDDTNAGLH